MTELSELGLERDAILNGDIAEYTPVDKRERKNKRNELYMASVVDKVTKAVFADLKTAYEQNDDLAQENKSLKDNNDQLSAQVNRLMNSVNKQQDYEQQLQSSESKLDKISQEMNRVQQMSAKLHTQLANAQKARDEAIRSE